MTTGRPKSRPPLHNAEVGERLARLEVLLEGVAERQGESILERQKIEDDAREHRHKTANALQVMGRSVDRLGADLGRQVERVDGILALVKPAADQREALDKRLKTIETIVANVRVSWKTVAWIATAVGVVGGAGFKLAGFFGFGK